MRFNSTPRLVAQPRAVLSELFHRCRYALRHAPAARHLRKVTTLVGLTAVGFFPAAALATPSVFDANSLTISASSGDSTTVNSNAGASNGDMLIYLSNATGDYVTFNVTVPATDTYTVAVKYHRNPNRGTVQLAVNGVNQGSAKDLYDSAGVFEEFDLGNVALTAGTTSFRFDVTGHNASSSSYRIALDTITLTPVVANPPTAPSSLASTSIGSTSINLAWSDNSSNEDNFVLERKTGSGGTYATIASPIANSTSYTDSGLTASTNYVYRIASTNAGGNSAYSTELSATTTSGGGGGSGVTYDANDLTVSASSGDSTTVNTNYGASNGNMLIYMSNAVGDYVTFNVIVPATDTYTISVRYHRNPNRGTAQLAINGVNQGSAKDLYDSAGVFEEFDLGNVALTAGTAAFRFDVTGHNASSSSYRIALDTITLTPATTTSRTDITTFSTIADALNSGVPLYAPPGTYTLPANFTPTADIDLLGDVNPSLSPTFNAQNPTFLPSNYSIRMQGIKFYGVNGPGAKLLLINSQTFNMPNYTVLDCTFEDCTPIQWATFPSITGQVIQRMEMRRFSISGANRGIFAQGRVDDYDITDFIIDDCGRFGICVGPSGPGINPTITSFMQRGSVARGVITGTVIQGANSAQLYLSGHNVVVEDMDLHNMLLPANYYSDPNLATEYPHDGEPFYTKVENLTVTNLYIENDGANQAMWANKGADFYTETVEEQSPNGSDATATNLVFVNTGIRYCVGIWHQTHGDNLYKNVTFYDRTKDAIIIHLNSASGTLTVEGWEDVFTAPNTAPTLGIKNKSLDNDTTTTPPAPDPVDVIMVGTNNIQEYDPTP